MSLAVLMPLAHLGDKGAEQLRPALRDVLYDVVRIRRQQLLERPVILQRPAKGR